MSGKDGGKSNQNRWTLPYISYDKLAGLHTALNLDIALHNKQTLPGCHNFKATNKKRKKYLLEGWQESYDKLVGLHVVLNLAIQLHNAQTLPGYHNFKSTNR